MHCAMRYVMRYVLHFAMQYVGQYVTGFLLSRLGEQAQPLIAAGHYLLLLGLSAAVLARNGDGAHVRKQKAA